MFKYLRIKTRFDDRVSLTISNELSKTNYAANILLHM